MSGRMITEFELNKVQKKYSKELENYMSYDYPISISKFDESGMFIASIEELPGCEGYGETAEEAIADMESSKRDWFLMSFRKDVFPPKPKELEKHDRVLLRLRPELHIELGKLAAQSDNSFNSYVVRILETWVRDKWVILPFGHEKHESIEDNDYAKRQFEDKFTCFARVA